MNKGTWPEVGGVVADSIRWHSLKELGCFLFCLFVFVFEDGEVMLWEWQ